MSGTGLNHNIGGWCVRLLTVSALAMGLSACAIPPAVSIASVAVDGILWLSTGKTKTDYGLSLVTGQDCATLRAFDGEDICRDDIEVVAMPPSPGDPLSAVVSDQGGAGDRDKIDTTPESVVASAPLPVAVATDKPSMAAPEIPVKVAVSTFKGASAFPAKPMAVAPPPVASIIPVAMARNAETNNAHRQVMTEKEHKLTELRRLKSKTSIIDE